MAWNTLTSETLVQVRDQLNTEIPATQQALDGKAPTGHSHDERYPAGNPATAQDGYVWTYDSASGGWLPKAAAGGVTDHGALSGLADDDHAIYALADGSRGAFSPSSHATAANNPHGVTAAQAGAAPSSHVGSGGTAHANATTSAAGFHSAADKTKLDSLTAQAVGRFRAYQTSPQTGIVHATFTKILFPVEEYDLNNWFANSRYTPQKAGYYKLSSAVGIGPSVASKRVFLSVYKNGVRYADLASMHTAYTAPILMSGDTEVYANGTTDYFEVFAYHDFGSGVTADTLGVQSSAWIAGGFLGTG